MPEKLNVRDWILANFKAATLVADEKEARFACPDCGHQSFYFNIIKRLGFCHKCHFSPNLKKLSKIIGSEPDTGLDPFFSPKTQNSSLPGKNVKFPDHAVSIKYDPKAVEALSFRGISIDTAEKHGIRVWRDFIMVPVCENGVLINIVARRFDRSKSGREIFSAVPHKERYLYQKGVRTSDYLFNFNPDIIHLTLVENTFNSIWLNQDRYGVPAFPGGFKAQQFVSNFGSYLSDRQIRTIANSRVTTVFFLWDAKAIATKYVNKLKELGIKAGSFFLKEGQPDDYDKTSINKISSEAHMFLGNGNRDFDQWVKNQPMSMYNLT